MIFKIDIAYIGLVYSAGGGEVHLITCLLQKEEMISIDRKRFYFIKLRIGVK
ncbi:hypothetical protein [Paenibacillus taichungensis]|uniref:hypothetical protein n=1 Tax=Paenibacillus taichungensis TaxID=484184 RepID=UPI00287784C1|nr:hypothetical protein [Paenibacillus taichungensis]